MSVARGDATSILSTSALTGISSDDIVLIACWLKRNGNLANPEFPIVLGQANALTQPYLALRGQTTGVISRRINTNSSNFTPDMPDTTWTHYAILYGPFDNVANSARRWMNGVEGGVGATTAQNNPGVDLDCLTLLLMDGNSALSSIAEIAIFRNPADAAAIVENLQTHTVDAQSIAPDYGWRLYDDASGSVGGVNLTAGGTAPVFTTADHPSLIDTLALSARRRPRVTWIG